ncbi:hypothetical protein AB7Z32_40140 [Bradyrhizobium sp. 482_C4_N1_1]|uniref:hypothetical protein n=1 Tax=unclassified Bradyrhizobium TaxID=2631580 RepID=UPI003F8B97FE
MTPSQAAELLGTLKEKSLTLEDLYERMRATGSSWTLEQLQLFLMCAPGVRHDRAAGTFHVASRGVDEKLQDAILEAVRSFAGKPIPAAQVRARLPNHFITTDEQVLALARRTPGLEIFGPKLIRIAQ